ncbi:MAG: hypothetical protein ACR2FE_00185 [Aeromicrobium sp.]
MRRRVDGRSVPLGELLDNLPEHLAQPPAGDRDAYNKWKVALDEYVAAAGYSKLELMREQVRRQMNPQRDRPRPRPAPGKKRPS